MASSTREFEFDVFLSFRGEDTRKGFTGHLYQALIAKGIMTFLDSEELETGRRIDDLLRSIERSEIFIPVFSKRYADSKWTLREMEKATACNRLILPVFFDVDPSDVRNQTGPFQPAFLVHEENETLDSEMVNGWRRALRKAGELAGHVLESHTHGDEAKLIQIVVKDVLSRLKWAPLDVAKHPIGVDPRVEHVMKLLHMEANDVRIVGIHGMGGIGKTTISRAIYNRIHRNFDGISFIPNITERSKQPNGLVDLQKQLIADLFNDDISSIKIRAPEQGISMIRRRVAYKKILLVLDDVDHRSQLESLAGNANWFYAGSRVLLASRDESLLIAHGLSSPEIYKVKELDEIESLQLFSYHAFRSVQPPAKYLKLSQEIAQTAGGLPLALEVHGSLSFDLKEMEDWEEMLGRLRRAPGHEVQQKLKVSYDGLTEEEKCIFLDISCFFVGKGKESAMQMWQDLELYPNLSIKVLVHKSLVKINRENGEFEMHDVMRDLGRDIVRQESPWDPWLRSRLWDADDILHVLQNPQDMCSHVQGIMLNSCTTMNGLRTDALSKMPKLRLLQINYAALEGDFLNLPKELTCLELIWCDLRCLVQTIPSSRGYVKLKYGELRMDFGRLRVLDLSNCYYPCLVRLTLDGCVKLRKVHVSIKHLKLLKFWSMRNCAYLKELPPEASALTSLEILNLSFCFSFETLPERLGDMKALKILILDRTRVKELPNSVTLLKRLSTVSLKECKLLVKLPELIGKLESLKDLIIAGTRLDAIPNSIGDIGNLQTLDATSCKSLLALPKFIGRLKNLRRLKLGHTMLNSGGDLKVLPYSFGRLRNLVTLEIPGPIFSNCPENLENLKNLMVLNLSCDGNNAESLYISDLDFDKFPSLKSMTLDGNRFYLLPSSIVKLSQLVELSICRCKCFSFLPQLPSSLMSLCASDCTSLKVAWDISNLKHLGKLDLRGCKWLLKIYGHQHLESLEEIDLRGCWRLERELDITCEKEEEELGWFFIPNSNQLLKLIIKVPLNHWMGRSVRSIGVLIYVTVGQEAIYESPRMAHEDVDEGVDSRFFVVYINNDDEICKYIGDESTSLHVRLGMQDLKSRHSGRITFEQLRQLHIAGRWFYDCGGEEEKHFFSCMIPKSPRNNCQLYIKELVLRGELLEEIKDPIVVFLKVMVQGILVFETTRVCDKLEDSKEDEDSGKTSGLEATTSSSLPTVRLKVKFGFDDAIHKVLGSASAVLHVSTSSLRSIFVMQPRASTPRMYKNMGISVARMVLTSSAPVAFGGWGSAGAWANPLSSSLYRRLNQDPLAERSTRHRSFDIWADVSTFFC